MKTSSRAWWVGMRDFLIVHPTSRQRQHVKRPPKWILMFFSLLATTIFMLGVYYIFQPRHPISNPPCSVFAPGGCATYDGNRLIPARQLTDEETTAQVVIREILNNPPPVSKNPKIAFMFLTPNVLPFEKLWEKFFEGHEERFTIYIHSSRNKPVHTSRYFAGRDIHSDKVEWGKISMVDAERRLLAHALLDPDNHQFILLSDSCVPLRTFNYVYNFLMFTNVSYIDSYVDPGPHGNGRYSEHMSPEVHYADFRKGAQWFSMKRQHAIIVMADSLYYRKFRLYCRPNMNGKNCYADEHYLQTFFTMIDPHGIAKWSVTHVDWSEGKWHPRSYRAGDITYNFLKNLTVCLSFIYFLKYEYKKTTWRPCLWNGVKRPCYLFARKFYPETMDKLLYHFSNYTRV
ncbi:Glycosyltransferase BC10 [Linum perenne]